MNCASLLMCNWLKCCRGGAIILFLANSHPHLMR